MLSMSFLLCLIVWRSMPSCRGSKGQYKPDLYGFRTLLDAFGIKPEDLPAGTFKDSGTQVKSCIVRIPSRRKATLAA